MVGASLVVQLLNNLLAMQETLSWVRKISWRRDRLSIPVFLGFPGDSDGKELPAMWDTWVQSLGWEGPLEEGMATHTSILAWRIPWTEEPGGLHSIGSQRVRHDWSNLPRMHAVSLKSSLLEILNLITSTKNFFLNKVTYISAKVRIWIYIYL